MICDIGENAASSSQRWLDELAERASLAGFVDREGAQLFLGSYLAGQ
jgi:post-segregation antitoxin (ccd killing protein)